MNNKLKKVFLSLSGVLGGLYVLFLLLPFMLSPVLKSHTKDIENFVKSSTGFETNIENISFITGWNLSAGVEADKLKLSVPASENPFFEAEKVGVKLSLLPVFMKKIQLDSLFAENLNTEIVVKKDGSFLIMDYLPQQENPSNEPFELPLGIKLSNKLPNIILKEYKISFVDAQDLKSYFIKGNDLKISDFVLDKKVKISTKGKIVFDNLLVSDYDLKLDNRIMPNLQLNDLVFPQEISIAKIDDEYKNTKSEAKNNFNIMDIFKAVNKNQFSADLLTDIKAFGTFKEPHLKGHFNVSALSVAVDNKKLPESYLDMIFNGNKTEIDSILYSSFDKEEKTQIIGSVTSGKNPSVDMTLRSNAKFSNIIALVDSIAQSFNIKDFNTLSATGSIDADFNINSDMKTVSSNGYLKVLPSSLSYGLYNVKISDITADINLENNNINIAKAGFSIFGHPLKLAGTILSDSTANLRLNGENLSIKGLLTALGQVSVLKENVFNSGLLSLDVLLNGKLKEIKPEISLLIKDLSVFNKQSQVKFSLKDALVKLFYDGKNASGDVDINSFMINYAGSVLAVPKTLVVINSNDINIKNSYILMNNSRVDIKGSVKDYLNEKLSINLTAKGNLQSVDIAKFLPVDFRNLISYKGKLPLNLSITGNTKVQNIKLDINADKNNYISLIDVDKLKNQNTKIHSNIEIIGDSLTFSGSGISNDKGALAILSGGISKLYSNPKLNLNIAVPNEISFPIWGIPASNITANGSVSVVGNIDNPQMRGTVNLVDISIKDLDFAITDLVADLSGAILNGVANARQFKCGGIVATDLSGKINLADYSKFYLTELSAKSFNGNVNGKLSYDFNSSKIALSLIAKGMNSTKAVEGAVGIKNALTGSLGFDSNLTMQGYTDKELINSMKGNITFNIDDGRFVGIGKLENLVAAQNVTSNSVLKSAISALSTFSAIQEADQFKSIKGEMTILNGNANISKILVSGPLMSYYVKGVYNILPNSANLVILGRLESKVVSCLGPLGQLSAEKLLSYIPKFGITTAKILNQLTSDPDNENISLIPQLTSGSDKYKDFKVMYNGPVESSTSVRSFKWLSQCDTSQMNVKQDLQNAKDAVKTNINNSIQNTKTKVDNVQKNVTNIVDNQKKQVEQVKKDFEQTKTDLQNAKENSQQSVENLKNLFQNALKNSQEKMPSQDDVKIEESQTVETSE
ncbi:hypothetical protein IJ541_02105 [bacterium]|nr:hypothetical protein [bacterium]